MASSKRECVSRDAFELVGTFIMYFLYAQYCMKERKLIFCPLDTSLPDDDSKTHIHTDK